MSRVRQNSKKFLRWERKAPLALQCLHLHPSLAGFFCSFVYSFVAINVLAPQRRQCFGEAPNHPRVPSRIIRRVWQHGSGGSVRTWPCSIA